MQVNEKAHVVKQLSNIYFLVTNVSENNVENALKQWCFDQFTEGK